MRFAHVSLPAFAEPRLAVVDDESAILVAELFPGAPRFLEELIAGGEELLDRVRAAADSGERHPLSAATYASALLTPPVILAIGLNYAAHSSELGLKTDS